jgi:predicted DNA-binding ribbon-helix-helix protein
MKSGIVKRSVVVANHKTSISLEDGFWEGLKEIARARNLTLSSVISGVDTDRRGGNLSSTLRVFILDHYKAEASRHRAEAVALRHTVGHHAADAVVAVVALGQENA